MQVRLVVKPWLKRNPSGWNCLLLLHFYYIGVHGMMFEYDVDKIDEVWSYTFETEGKGILLWVHAESVI